MHQVNNTALGQVIVLPSPGSAQYNSVIQKVMSCHICFGELFQSHEAQLHTPILAEIRFLTTGGVIIISLSF